MAKTVYNIYTVSAFYKAPRGCRNKKCVLHPYESLSDEYREWVIENTIKLMEKPTECETMFEQYLQTQEIEFEKQVFFRINDKSYFLDFYIPEYNVAIEIDGGIHKKQKKYDSDRDNVFRRIGIETIRIFNSYVRTLTTNSDFKKWIENKVKGRKDLQEYIRISKEEEEEELHYWDDEVNLNIWRSVSENPKKTKRYLVMCIYNHNVVFDTAVYNAEYDNWVKDGNTRFGKSSGQICYWLELPKNPICDRPDKY